MVGQAPNVGTFKVQTNNPLAIDASSFTIKYEKHVAEQVYRLHKALLRHDFIGKHIADPSKFHASFSAIHQVHTDPVTNLFAIRTVEEYHILFTEVLDIWDPSAPMGTDPVQTF